MLIELVFYNFHPYEKSRWLLNYSSTYISNVQKNITIYVLLFLIVIEFHTMLGKKPTQKQIMDFFNIKPPTIFHFFNFTSHVHIKNHHLPPNSHWNITAALPRINHIRRFEKKITWTIHYQTLWLSTIHENNPRSWRWWNQRSDSTQDIWIFWGREFFRRHRVLCFIFDPGWDMIYASFRI